MFCWQIKTFYAFIWLPTSRICFLYFFFANQHLYTILFIIFIISKFVSFVHNKLYKKDHPCHHKKKRLFNLFFLCMYFLAAINNTALLIRKETEQSRSYSRVCVFLVSSRICCFARSLASQAKIEIFVIIFYTQIAYICIRHVTHKVHTTRKYAVCLNVPTFCIQCVLVLWTPKTCHDDSGGGPGCCWFVNGVGRQFGDTHTHTLAI